MFGLGLREHPKTADPKLRKHETLLAQRYTAHDRRKGASASPARPAHSGEIGGPEPAAGFA